MKHRIAFVAVLLLALSALSAPRDVRAQPAPAQLAGMLPAHGGFAFVVWSGGTIATITTAANAGGCPLIAVWVLDQGTFIGSVIGAPTLVNQPFNSRFPNGPPSGPVIVVCGGSPVASTARSIAGCPLFPDDNPWAADISGYPVDPRSDSYINYILASGGNQNLHADFGSDPSYGIPYVIVPESQAGVPVTFDYADESDPGPYPIPPNVPIEAGSDHHALIVQTDTCKLFELYELDAVQGSWHAGSGAIFDLRSDALRPDNWTSADAAGLPILAGLARLDEVRAGAINHALRFTVSRTQQAFIHPATHYASTITDPNAPPMGLRLRLKASFDLAPFHGEALVVLTALRHYGMFVADNGSNWYISGGTDPGWDDTDLNQLKTVPGSAFEVVSSGPVVTH